MFAIDENKFTYASSAVGVGEWREAVQFGRLEREMEIRGFPFPNIACWLANVDSVLSIFFVRCWSDGMTGGNDFRLLVKVDISGNESSDPTEAEEDLFLRSSFWKYF
jgi:hypothetical protein